ncbi:MAG: hypothetical protein DMG09_29435 [Acidobacteria bacterium]|nr:MAG: hypothetical protein DMG09_29435 [Acidobacteriota bacterium]
MPRILACLPRRATLDGMQNDAPLLDLATKYHKALPGRTRRYLNDRGIPDLLIDFHLLGWNEGRITIPIFNRMGELTFFKLARDPEAPALAPKMLASPGAYAELYGWDQVHRKPKNIIICEGEFDRLVLEGKGFIAVTSTGGAGTFRKEWADEFKAIPNVYICYDRDEAGERGAERVSRMIPHAKIVELPEEVGKGGDVTDFFVRLGKTPEDFIKLMDAALPAPPSPDSEARASVPRAGGLDPITRERVRRIKNQIPITSVIVGQYVRLERYGEQLMGRCPFHDDRNPSLAVYTETNTFHCFGCFKHGDVITFLREIEQLGFGQALDALDQMRFEHESKTA